MKGFKEYLTENSFMKRQEKLEKIQDKIKSMKPKLVTAAKKHNWKKVRDKNGSMYFERPHPDNKFKHERMRFSDHELTSNWTGVQQTGGADYDVVQWWDIPERDYKSLFTDTDEFLANW